MFVNSGSDDFLLHVAVPDNDHLYAFVIDRLTEKPEAADGAPRSSTSISATPPLSPPAKAGDRVADGDPLLETLTTGEPQSPPVGWGHRPRHAVTE